MPTQNYSLMLPSNRQWRKMFIFFSYHSTTLKIPSYMVYHTGSNILGGITNCTDRKWYVPSNTNISNTTTLIKTSENCNMILGACMYENIPGEYSHSQITIPLCSSGLENQMAVKNLPPPPSPKSSKALSRNLRGQLSSPSSLDCPGDQWARGRRRRNHFATYRG